ncbi:hypothetical protein U2G71_004325 [Vibrio vulnificus]|nr:hypothetical protein [Vibrio vulnificus]
MNKIELKFTDSELANELRKIDISDVSVGQRVNVFDCSDPEVMIASNKILTFIVTTGSSVALSLFSSWLYDKLKAKGGTESIKINGVEISGNHNNLKIEIHNHIQPSDSEKQT